MKVKDLMLYKAIYCGLCKVMKKEISYFLPMSISYDYVFLAALRAALAGETFKPKSGRCAYNPFRRKVTVMPCKVLSDTALSALVLTKISLDDKIADKDSAWYKMIVYRLYRKCINRALARCIKRDESGKLSAVCKNAEEKMIALQEAECSAVDSPDIPAVLSGEMLKEAVAFGFDGEDAEKLQSVMKDLGSLIYWLDAVDDLEKDVLTGSYNPLLLRYKTPEAVLEQKMFIDMVMSQYSARMMQIIADLPQGQTYAILENICSQGLGAMTKIVLSREKKGKK